jgi:hypothetical protein
MQKQKNQEKIRKMKKKFNIPDIYSSESEEIDEIE